MRITKEHDERRNEIIWTANRLFSVKGYGKCTVNDILNEVGIAKGTFYYYFKSKEEVLDAIIEAVVEGIEKELKKIVNDNKLLAEQKMLKLFMAMKVDKEVDHGIMDEMHKPDNAVMHQKSLRLMVERMTPYLVEVIKEGVDAGIFEVSYPKQCIQIFLASALTLLDDGIFEIEKEEQGEILRALIMILEKMLGVKENQFWDLFIKSAQYKELT